MHPTCLPSSSPLPHPSHSSAFLTFDQNKMLENEPERRDLREASQAEGGQERGQKRGQERDQVEQGTREKRAKEEKRE